MQTFFVDGWHVKVDEGLLTRKDVEKRLQPKVMQVLLCLVEEQGSLVSRDELLRRVWGERAVSDEPLTRCIKELRSAFEDSASDPQFIETLPKRGYRLVAKVTANSVSDGRDDEPSPVLHVTRMPALWGFLAFAVLIAGLAWWLWPHKENQLAIQPDPSVAVLPFENLSGNADQEFLADGITATLTQVLSRNPQLRVVARSSAFVYKGKSVGAREIGEGLGVGTLLEGSLQRDGDTLRITAQLVDAASGVNLWSAAFDRPVDELFVLQDEIAADVTTALSVTLLDGDGEGVNRYGAENFDAYMAYARGLDGMRFRTIASMSSAIEQFRSAVAIDPSFALAWVGLAEALMVNQWYANEPLDEVLEQAETAINRALEIDPESGEAWSAVGLMEFKRANYEESERAFQKAVSLVPNNARAWFLYGTLLNDTGRPAEALEKHRISSQLDPLAPVVLTAIGVALEKLGRFDEARTQYSKIIEIDPDYPAAHDRLGILSWVVYGNAKQALASHRKALALDPNNTWSRSLVVNLALGVNDPQMAEDWTQAAMQRGASKLYPNLSRAYLMAFREEPALTRMEFSARWLRDAFTSADIDILLRIYRDAALSAGYPDKALDLYRQYIPELFEEPLIGSTALYGPAIDVAYLLKLGGEEQRANQLLGMAWDVISDLPVGGCCGHGIADVEILAISGRHDEALLRLERAFDADFRNNWWWQTSRNPNLSSLHDNTTYLELEQHFLDRANSERSGLPADRAPD